MSKVSAKSYVAWTEIDAARTLIGVVLDSGRLDEISPEVSKHLKVVFEKLDDLLCCAQTTLDPAGELLKVESKPKSELN